ncbi:hypothetical protein K2173_011156 [Erythroxylum novogranatense]|uniref:ARID domain-containing protein n=1 Tax=Erythroxylum novogranatense TaxID=1862640 RepID=A0AAV8T8G6_9ROSI|nr:hypothetical protein K2173_011156 [Erythroxylum novogranatense]
MKGRETKGVPSADLLVCFPSRAHLTLMPKPICSPARPSEPNKRHHNYQQHQNQHHHHNHHHHFRKSSTRGGVGQASPMLWSKTKQMGTEISSEPTSPKVTCAGQIKVRHKNSACKSWQSVMEEIERIHNKKHKKKSTWMESLGFKKEVTQFLACLRNIRFDFRCFGSFPQADVTTEDDEDEEEDEDQYHGTLVGGEGSDGSEASRTVFSKWFMVLQENQNNSFCKDERKKNDTLCSEDQTRVVAPSVPPPNALLLMRCRSAPAKNWLEQKEEEEEEEEKKDDDQDHGDKDEDRRREKKGKNLKTLMEEEKTTSKKESLVVMKYDTDFYKVSTDIAKETWVVGGISDTLSRSRSWKR